MNFRLSAECAQKTFFSRFQQCKHCCGIRCGAEICQKGCAMCEQTQPGEHMKMKLSVSAVDEEEYVGTFIVRRAEENGTVCAAKRQKRFRNEIFVMEFDVQKRGAAADCR